jgi:trehalose-6-phosphatase
MAQIHLMFLVSGRKNQDLRARIRPVQVVIMGSFGAFPQWFSLEIGVDDGQSSSW